MGETRQSAEHGWFARAAQSQSGGQDPKCFRAQSPIESRFAGKTLGVFMLQFAVEGAAQIDGGEGVECVELGLGGGAGAGEFCHDVVQARGDVRGEGGAES